MATPLGCRRAQVGNDTDCGLVATTHGDIPKFDVEESEARCQLKSIQVNGLPKLACQFYYTGV